MNLTSSYDICLRSITSRYRVIIRLYGLIILTAIIHIDAKSLSAQEFAPVGAVWIHTEVSFQRDTTIIFTESIKDTIVNDRRSQVLRRSVLSPSGRLQVFGQEIVSSSNDSVLIFLQDTFRTLFVFDAAPGDTIEVYGRLESEQLGGVRGLFELRNDRFSEFSYRVDSTSFIIVENDTLTIQYTSYLDDSSDNQMWGFQDLIDRNNDSPGRILEGVGSINGLSAFGSSSNTTYVVDLEPQGLDCYFADSKEISFAGTSCQRMLSTIRKLSSVDQIEVQSVSVYPNPFTDQIWLESVSSEIVKLSIYNSDGLLILSQTGLFNSIHLPNLPSGVYVLRITNGADYSLITKLFKS